MHPSYITEPKRDWRGLHFRVKAEITIHPYGYFRPPTILETTGRIGSQFKGVLAHKLSPHNTFIEVFRRIKYKGGQKPSEPRWIRLPDLFHFTEPVDIFHPERHPHHQENLRRALNFIKSFAPRLKN